MTKIIISLISLLIIALALAWAVNYWQISQQRLRLFPLLFVKPLEEIKNDYAQRSCQEFSQKEKEQGYFIALVTGYCRPQSADFTARHDFLCAVGLNCSCPNGRQTVNDCFSSYSFSWSSCLDFDETIVPYCHQTASETQPQPGQIAADWNCFTPGSIINIENQDYQVTDKGSAITGRRFDLWFDDCRHALSASGLYRIKIPEKIE